MDKLGIQPLALLAQTVNFAIIAFILAKFLYKPILKMIDDRKKKIEDSLKITDMLKEEEEKTEKKRTEILDKAKKEAGKIIEEARDTAKKKEAEILEDAKKDAEQIIVKGKKDLDLEKAEVEKYLKKQTIEIASDMAKRIIMKALGDSEHQKIIDNKISDIIRLEK
jgi:F-type H+-transporting ATPase subunit b